MRAVLMYVLSNDDKEDDNKRNTQDGIKLITRIDKRNEKLVRDNKQLC